MTRADLIRYLEGLPSYEMAKFRKPTIDDWHPTWGDDCVKISALFAWSRPKYRLGRLWYIRLYGADDDAMAQWYSDYQKFYNDLAWLSRIPFVSKNDLHHKGFVEDRKAIHL